MTSWNRMSPKPGINPDNPLNPISPPPCRGRAREGVESQISRRANPHPNLPPTKGKGRFGANDLSGIKGLYAITPDSSDTADLLRRTRLVLSGGARVLQYRNKSANAVLRLTQAGNRLCIKWDRPVKQLDLKYTLPAEFLVLSNI